MVNFLSDREMLEVFGGVLALLVVATVIGRVLAMRATDEKRPTISNLNARINAWWAMCLIFAFALLAGRVGAIILFGFLSFGALREFITLTPTKPADHHTLFWVFFVILPLQYWLIWDDWYGLFSILIPVYAFLFIPSRIAISGDPERFLERSAKIQWGLMISVYCVSHIPALLMLNIPNFHGKQARLVFFLVLVAQMSDVLQYVWGKLFGRHKVAPVISPNKTWEGFVGGILSATALGTALWWLTPFTVAQTAMMSLTITILGFLGGITMSAIKRDRGVKDYGSSIGGHGGILDRIDSLCFAGPVFFHVVRYWFTP